MSVEERREYGVGFAVKKTLLQYVKVGSDRNEDIATVRLHFKKGIATVISVYAHTLYTDEQIKDTFYDKLNLIVKKYQKTTNSSFWVILMQELDLITTLGLPV